MKGLLFDIGANRGLYAMANLHLFNTIICAEPNPDLLHNLSRINEKIKIINYCVGSKTDTNKFYISDEYDVVSTCDPEWVNNSRFTRYVKWNKEIEVKQTTIDIMVENFGIPDFIKIDTEGYELEVIKGMTKKYCPLIFEVADEKKNDIIEILDYLKKLGYTKSYYLCNNDQYDFDYSQVEKVTIDNMKSLVNMVFNEKFKYHWGMIYCE